MGGQSHGHGHHHHHATNATALGRAAILTGVFMVAELLGGLVAGSLALVADAGHMLTDFAALSMAWLALRIARKPADERRTYGFDRVSVLAAFVNGLALFLVAGWILFEAADRFVAPEPVMGNLMLALAIIGLLVNVTAFWILTRGDRENLNLRAALLHVMGDLLGSVAAIVAAVIILLTGWTPIDPILSVLVALLILRSAWTIIRESAHILLEGAPVGFDRDALSHDLVKNVPDVSGISHVHAWSISQERPVVTLVAMIKADSDRETVSRNIKNRLSEEHGFNHATVELTTSSPERLPDRCLDPI